MRNRNIIEFLGLWEQLNTQEFKGIEFDAFRNQAGLTLDDKTIKIRGRSTTEREMQANVYKNAYL